MEHQRMPFGIKLSAFLAAILVLTYAVVAIAPEPSDEPGTTMAYAALAS